jgi:hypothetical protein
MFNNNNIFPTTLRVPSNASGPVSIRRPVQCAVPGVHSRRKHSKREPVYRRRCRGWDVPTPFPSLRSQAGSPCCAPTRGMCATRGNQGGGYRGVDGASLSDASLGLEFGFKPGNPNPIKSYPKIPHSKLCHPKPQNPMNLNPKP